MSRIRPRDTGPELRLRRALWSAGLRYRKHAKTPVGRPDIVFPGARVAVFVDGGFFHGCPHHYVRPRTRDQFWADKLAENVARDRRQTLQLEADGWTVVRLWECEVYESLESCVDRVRKALEGTPIESDADWRVVMVVPLDDEGTDERRFMESLRAPDKTSFTDGPRITAKWKRPR